MHRREHLLILLAALAALACSGAWFATTAATWRAEQTQRLITQGTPVSRDTLLAAHALVRNPDSFLIPGPHLHLPAQLTASLLADGSDADQEDLELTLHAQELAMQALVREPAHSKTWALLAYARYTLDGPSKDALAALRLSIYTAPARPSLIHWRLALAARNHAFWDVQMANLVRGQILAAWRNNPRMLAQTAAANGLVPLARLVLSADPEELKRLESLVARHGQS